MFSSGGSFTPYCSGVTRILSVDDGLMGSSLNWGPFLGPQFCAKGP